MHDQPHPLRGKTIHLPIDDEMGAFQVEDWADIVVPNLAKTCDISNRVYGRLVGDAAPRSITVDDTELRQWDEASL